MLPTRAARPRPPVAHISQIHGVTGWREYQRARLELLVRRFRSAWRKLTLHLFPINGPLCSRDVTGGFDESAKLGVGHVVPIHPESVELHQMGRSFVDHR